MLFLTVLSQCLLISASSISWLSSSRHLQDSIRIGTLANDPIVKTSNGSVSGLSLPTYNQEAFLGIPFAAPPVGPLRFRAPQPLRVAWNDVRPAKSYGAGCAQWSNLVTDPKEDCLTLNSKSPIFSLNLSITLTQCPPTVVRPANVSRNANLPVFVAIYGGGYKVGASSEPGYNLSGLVSVSQRMKTPIIGVSMNYRLDVWGFLASKSIVANGDANAGLLDQVAALRWVQDNIGEFGGDKKRVTIWGVSAGGQSIGAHLHSFGGKNLGLYSGAIMESGGPVGAAMPPLEHYTKHFEQLKSQHGCGDISADPEAVDCLRKVPEKEFFAKKSTALWNPIVGRFLLPSLIKSQTNNTDGQYLTEYFSSMTPRSSFVKVPVITGANSDEGLGFGNARCASDAEISKWLTNWRGHNLTTKSINRLVELYDNPSYDYPPFAIKDRNTRIPNFAAKGRKASAIGGDLVMLAQVRKVAQAWTKAGVKAWTFRFDTRPWNQSEPFNGVRHGVEVTFSLQNMTGKMGPHDDFKHHRILGEKWGAAYVNFVAWADPNPAGGRGKENDGVPTLPYWPSYDEHAVNMVLNATQTDVEMDDYRKEGIDFINSISRELMV
jgi:carboxylesterase type B